MRKKILELRDRHRLLLLTVNLGFEFFGSSPCSFRKSFVRINFENNVIPDPPPGVGILNFMMRS